MNYELEAINGLSILTFADTATNHADARDGSALAMVKYANDNSIGDATDWVLPTRETLMDLYQLLGGEDRWYWSSSPYVGNSYGAWYVDFNVGYADDDNRIYSLYVRLVRASQLFDIGLAAVNKRFGVSK
jgi:hypothetical protein